MRTITTLDELRELPPWSIGYIEMGGYALAWQKIDGVLVTTGGVDLEIEDYQENMPVVVLWEPPQ